jgi:very-short-patch-repair endonuclease
MPARDDQRLAVIARQQYGTFTRHDAHRCGFTDRQIRIRIESGLWERLGSSVFSIAGTPNGWQRDAMVACLRSGGVASHQTAARLHGFPRIPIGPVVVTTRPSLRRTIEGIVVHESSDMGSDWRTTAHGVPVFTAGRTIVDLSAVLGLDRMERVLDDALGAGRVELGDVVDAFNGLAGRGRRRIARLRPLLVDRGDGAIDTTELERMFTDLIRRFGLPEPVRQVNLDGDRPIGIVDFFYADNGLVVEVDGRRGHLQRLDFERDRRRDQLTLMRGLRPVRFTYRQLRDHPEQVADVLRSLLRGAA